MLGNDATEFLKTLHKLDDIWNLQEDAEYNERQLVQFAERYHQSKVKENELLHDVSNRLNETTLEEINTIMWESHMIKSRTFDRTQGTMIMNELEKWAKR